MVKKVRKMRQLRIQENINAWSRAFYECIVKGDPLASACRLSRVRLIIRIKYSALAPPTIMQVAENYSELLADAAPLNYELREIRRSKISLHRAKAGYSYPTIRLPHTFSKLAGLSTRIYQTIYDGSLAFLTVISPTENASKTPKASVFTRRRPVVQIAIR